MLSGKFQRILGISGGVTGGFLGVSMDFGSSQVRYSRCEAVAKGFLELSEDFQKVQALQVRFLGFRKGSGALQGSDGFQEFWWRVRKVRRIFSGFLRHYKRFVLRFRSFRGFCS